MTARTDLALELAIETTSREGVPRRVGADERRTAFNRLVREHLPVLHGLARRLGPGPDDAEDLVQETLLKAWRGYRGFRRQANPRTWLYRILLNACHDLWRRRNRLLKRRRTAATESEAPDPAGVMDRRDLLGRVLSAVEALPRRQRECLLLRSRGGLSYREIARVLRIREGVVKAHLVQGRRTLSRRFGDEALAWRGPTG